MLSAGLFDDVELNLDAYHCPYYRHEVADHAIIDPYLTVDQHTDS